MPTPFAVVTGASSGIGLALARRFDAEGVEVVMAADEEAVEAEAAALTCGRAVRADLATEEGVDHLVAAVREIGEPTSLVLNAGTAVGGEFAGGTALSDQLRAVDLDVRAVVHLAKVFLPAMVRRGHGRVLVTSSIVDAAPGPYQVVYNASKAFLSNFTAGLRAELRGTGVTVTTLRPGPTATAFFARSGQLDTPLAARVPKDDPEEVAAQAYEAMMAGRPTVYGGSPLTRVAHVLTRLTPERLAATALGWVTKPRGALR
ncbi:hypothetical protein BJP25_18445 [Actinokineospora bangkokensis]|uniref:Oxidoreductase n=1 Tax=Actinokineospora bangkokensis TaxID=1193682 RepID=A0A1Q9LM46_9PSEU|nr:hypothetical protein BJP25_18445 [Actinokineospora bangkokensis]